MRLIIQLFVILCFTFVGDILNALIPLPIPACIYGIVLLYLALHFKIVKVKDVKDVSSFLIKALPLLLLPVSVGIIDTWDDVKGNGIAFVVISVVSTFVVIAVAGFVTQMIIRHGRKEVEK